jgi:hypothetical protein
MKLLNLEESVSWLCVKLGKIQFGEFDPRLVSSRGGSTYKSGG